MKQLNDDYFWSLVDMFESGEITKEELLIDICNSNSSVDAAISDFELACGNSGPYYTATKKEKEKIKEIINAKKRKTTR